MPKTNTNSATSSPKKKNKDPLETKPYNRYNIFYILERELFLQSNSGYQRKRNDDHAIPLNFTTGYEDIDLPDLPPRFASLDLPFDWYMPGKRKLKKRDHKKSHGLASFQDLARIVANGYKIIDDETLEYVTTVATLLKQQHNVLRAMKTNHVECSAVACVSDTRRDENKSAQHYITQPSHIIVSAPAQPRLPNMSDLLLNSTAPAGATNISSMSNTIPMKCFRNNSCSDAPQAQVVLTSASISEVDIDDSIIMAMWHFN